MKKYRNTPGEFLGRPRKPGYLDKKNGRANLVITSQNFSVLDNGKVRLPYFLEGICIKARHSNVRQIRICTKGNYISVQLMYLVEEIATDKKIIDNKKTMSIDIGVDNLMTAVVNTEETPVIINGRPLKSINQFYNKKKAALQEIAKKSNKRDETSRMGRLTRKRNSKIKDYLHKASRKIVDMALDLGVGLIVIGNNKGWKQEVSMGKKTNQNFVSIPYKMLIDMISYKAKLVGINVKVVKEKYTSGTSYLDGETPDKRHYNKSRRIRRGLFKSDKGILINADANAAYQIMKIAEIKMPIIKEKEKIKRINVA